MYAQCMRHFSHRHVGPMLGAFEKFLNDPIYTLLTWHILKKNKIKKLKKKKLSTWKTYYHKSYTPIELST